MPRRETENTEPPVETPWGPSQMVTEYGIGIKCYECAGHGGFHLSPERMAQLPPTLRSFVGYGGVSWYEEDCDWAIVALAFPDYFEPRAIFHAERTARNYHKAETEAFFKTADGQKIVEIADRYLRENGEKYAACGGSSGDNGSWHARYRRVDDGEPVITLTTPRGGSEPEARLYTYDELIAMGGKPVVFARPQTA